MNKVSIIITGHKSAGKSTLCWQVLKYLYILGIKAAGVITLQNDKKWFYIISLKTKIPFEAGENENFVPIGHFRVHKENLKKVVLNIRSNLGCEFLFIDEIGLLELQGEGYHPILDAAISREKNNIFVVKKRILSDFQDQYPSTKRYHIVDVRNRQITEPFEKIKILIENHIRH
ncbi:MAG: nucleoside-triphosphatase [Candidatus Hodarchaeota archaeon]